MDSLAGRRTRRGLLHRNRRGVSPIIATILLVAITVALAATLYVLLIPLIGHTTNPLSSNFAWGTSSPKTGGTGNPGCAPGDYCWRVSISTPNTGTVTPSSLNLYVQNASGLTVSNATWTFAFLTSTNSVVATAPGPTAGSSSPGWTGSGTSNPLTLAMYLWIDTGGPTAYTGQPVVLQTVGVNGFTGGLTTNLAT